MTRKDIINDTAEFFQKNPRATVRGACMYVASLPDGTEANCAVGRYMTDQAKLDSTSRIYGGISCWPADPEKSGISVTSEPGEKYIPVDSVLKDEYKGHETQFWAELQYFHDDVSHWGGRQLTERGKNYLATLHAKWDETN